MTQPWPSPFPGRTRLFDMRLLTPLLAALVPLLITPGLLAYFDITPKIAILLFGLALTLLYPRAIAYNLRSLLQTRPGRWLAAWLAAEWLAVALACAFSSHRELSLYGGNWRRFGLIPETGLLVFVLLAAGWLAQDIRNVRTVLRAGVASGALAAVYGIAQYFGWDPLLPSRAYEAGEGAFTIVRPPGTLGHADYFAAWLVVVVFFGLALERLEEPGWRKVAVRAGCVLAAVAIVLSGTRAALLGLLIGIVVFLTARGKRVTARAVVLGIICAAGLVAFFFTPAGARLRARVHWSLEDARGGARLLLWRDSLRMAAHRPVAGFGPETFATEFPRFESAELARAYPDFYHESPHNIFMDALTSQGVLGLAALLGLCGLAAWAAAGLFRSRHRLAAALTAGLAAVLIAQQFAVFVFATALYFHLLVAVIVVSAASAIPAGEPARRFPGWAWVPLAAASLVLAACALQLLVADRALAVAEQRIAAGDANGAVAAYRSVLRWQPPGTSSDLAYSRDLAALAARTPIFITQLAAQQQALEAGIRAVSVAEDRQNAWYNLAMLLASENDAAGVDRALRNSITWAPNWFKPHWALAQLLDATRHPEEALAEARIAADLDGGHDPEIAATLHRLEASAAPR